MHEIGHNCKYTKEDRTAMLHFSDMILIGNTVGLGHSTQLSDPSLLQGEYEDRTCTMGIDDRQTRKCFNVSISFMNLLRPYVHLISKIPLQAPKSEQLGWYDESYITNFDAPPEANILDKCLFGVGEYSLQPDASEYQLWYRIGDIYITFNRDAGPNAQTQECRDKVLIHRAPTFSPEGVELSSDLLMCLKSGETYIGEGYMVNVKDIDTRIEPGCARISVLVGETAAPTALDGTLEPTMTPEPSPAPTTEVFSIDFSITNFFNDNPVTITIIGSCNNVVLERTLPAGMAGNGRFTANVEDLYRVFITDAGGNGGATYTISYRGVQQVSNDNFSTAETCHLVGAESPICDDIECPATESPSQSPSKMPVPAPTPAPVPPPTPAPTEAPVPVTGPETSESPTTSFEPSASPTASPAPSNSPMPSTRPGRCLIEVMIDKCGELVADQSPVEDCDCYNYCNGLFLGCCPYDMFCPVSCPSSDFVAGCELDMTMAPSSSPSMSPVTQPTGRPTQVLPPSIDDPPMQLPTFPPLPPSEDGFRPLPPSGDPFPVGQTARGEPYGYNTYYNNYGASPYVEEVEIPASPVESFWATSVLTRGRYGNRKAVSRRLEEIGDKKFERFRSKIQGKRKGPMS